MKTRINLLSPALLPVQARLTLPRVLLGWGGMLLLIIALHLFQQYQMTTSQAHLAQLEQQHQQLQQTSETLSSQLASMAPSAILVNQKQRLESELAFQKQLIGQIEFEASRHYSEIMAALAEADHKDIWLTTIQYDGQRIALNGGARTPASVAEWMAALGQQPPFVGHSFDKIELSASGNAHTFQLNSQLGGEKQEAVQ